MHKLFTTTQLKKEKYKPLLSNVSQSQGEDLKLLLVPFIFLLLRVWSTALDIYVYYGTSIDDNGKRLKTQAAAALVLLAVSYMYIVLLIS